MVLLMVVVMTDVDMVHGVNMGVLFSSLYFLELIDQDQNKNKCPQCAAPSKNNKSRKEKKRVNVLCCGTRVGIVLW